MPSRGHRRLRLDLPKTCFSSKSQTRNVHTRMEPNNLHTRAQNQTTCTRARNQTTLWTYKAFQRVFKGIFQKGVYGWLPLNGFSKAFKRSLVISTAGLGVIFTAGLGVISTAGLI